MALMVFGNPITKETLKGMPEYQNKITITRTDKAHVALKMKKETEARALEYMENLKKEKSDCDGGVITFGEIYNETGGTIRFSGQHDFSGKLAAESTYPGKIKNGQCGVFIHKETSGKTSGSCGAVVYWGKNKVEEACDWMLSWSNPTDGDNKVFTDIDEHGHYKRKSNDPIWNHVYEELSKSSTTSERDWNGCDSSMRSTPSNKVTNGVDVHATVKLATA
uniref:Uncharacterized protein n=1 Tax=Camellia sinensis TaxID=4442 RepID=D3GDK6_CAMSI|nr:hypothetical protein [Camellia sinensis]